MAFWKPSRPKLVEPAVTSATTPVSPIKPVIQPPPKKPRPDLSVLDETDDEAADTRNRGFDPYNSGAFNAKDTWQRINRKK